MWRPTNVTLGRILTQNDETLRIGGGGAFSARKPGFLRKGSALSEQHPSAACQGEAFV